MDHMTNTSQPGRHAQAGDAPVADRWLLRVRGAVDVEIEDERGNRIGRYIPGGEIKEEEREEPGEEKEGRERPSHPDQANQDLPNLWEVTIPGATYHPGRTVTSVFLGQPGRYTCRFRGRSASAMPCGAGVLPAARQFALVARDVGRRRAVAHDGLVGLHREHPARGIAPQGRAGGAGDPVVDVGEHHRFLDRLEGAGRHGDRLVADDAGGGPVADRGGEDTPDRVGIAGADEAGR